MLETFLSFLPLSLGGAVNPFGILIIFFLLAQENKPLKKTWLFILGSITFLVLLIFLEYFLLKYTIGVGRHQTSISASIDVAFGVLLIFLAIFRKAKPKVKSQKSGKSWKMFVFGFVFMITDLSTLVLYIAAVKIIFEDRLILPINILFFALNILIAMSTMALPVFLATVAPKKSSHMLSLLKNFISKYGQLVSKIVIILIALYLIFKGVRFFI